MNRYMKTADLWQPMMVLFVNSLSLALIITVTVETLPSILSSCLKARLWAFKMISKDRRAQQSSLHKEESPQLLLLWMRRNSLWAETRVLTIGTCTTLCLCKVLLQTQDCKNILMAALNHLLITLKPWEPSWLPKETKRRLGGMKKLLSQNLLTSGEIFLGP